jgi:hypothetical protein
MQQLQARAGGNRGPVQNFEEGLGGQRNRTIFPPFNYPRSILKSEKSIYVRLICFFIEKH